MIVEPLKPLSIAIDSVNLDQANARAHDERNVEAIKASLDEFGQRQPVVVQKQGMVVRAGNARVMAAKALGWSEIAAIVVDEDDVAATAYAIADNRTAELATWDTDVLDRLMAELPPDMAEATGFTDAELEALLEAPAIVEDDAPEADDGPTVAQPGDIWTCGRHRLACGDSTDDDCVTFLLDGATPNLMVTDPPYGVEYDPEWRNEAARKGQLAYAAKRVGEVNNDDRADWNDAFVKFPGHVAYVWHAAGPLSAVVCDSLTRASLPPRMQIIWSKPHFPITRGHYTVRHEPCWYCVREGETASWIGAANEDTVWHVPLDANVDGGHSTQKPVELMAHAMRNHEGDVYDPFLGSGTTMIAAEQMGRTCYAIEIEPRYVDVALRRYMAFTGDTPVRHDGVPFTEAG